MIDRTAVVTGGGTGIGRAVAGVLAEAGHDVVITGRRADVLARAAAEVGARAVPFDATDPVAIEAALAELPDGIDVLVNNGGGNTDIGAPEPAGLAGLRRAWLANLEANLLSAVLVTAALDGRLRAGGRVITLGSIVAHQGAAGYGAAKAGVAAWTAGLAFELGPRGITANVVAPGLVAGTEFFRGRLTAERRDALVARTATGRAGSPADIAATVAFLASPGAGHITGQVLHVNGGALMR